MIRYSRDVLSLICLPLLVCVMVMWVRSYFVLDRLTYRSLDNEDCHLRSDCGHVTWFWTTPVFPHRHVLAELRASILPPNNYLYSVYESIGFTHEFSHVPAMGTEPAIDRSLTMVPYWFLSAMVGAAPAWRLREKWKKIRAEKGAKPQAVG